MASAVTNEHDAAKSAVDNSETAEFPSKEAKHAAETDEAAEKAHESVTMVTDDIRSSIEPVNELTTIVGESEGIPIAYDNITPIEETAVKKASNVEVAEREVADDLNDTAHVTNEVARPGNTSDEPNVSTNGTDEVLGEAPNTDSNEPLPASESPRNENQMKGDEMALKENVETTIAGSTKKEGEANDNPGQEEPFKETTLATSGEMNGSSPPTEKEDNVMTELEPVVTPVEIIQPPENDRTKSADMAETEVEKLNKSENEPDEESAGAKHRHPINDNALPEVAQGPIGFLTTTDIAVNDNTIITTAAVHDTTRLEDVEDVPDSETVSLTEMTTMTSMATPVTKAVNHRAFQNLIDENESLKRNLKKKEEKIESMKTKNKVLQQELDATRGKGADMGIYSKKLEMAISENVKLKSTTGKEKDENRAYSEMELAFLTRKYQESKVVEEALRNQISLNANVKDQDNRTIEDLTRRVKQLDKDLKAKDTRVARMELEMTEVTQIVSGFEEFVDANVYRQVVEKAKGKSPINGDKRIKSGRKGDAEKDAVENNADQKQSKVCAIL